MPDMHQPEPAAAGIPPAAMVAAAADDVDYPLGCECADPALQIERWSLEAMPTGTGLS